MAGVAAALPSGCSLVQWKAGLFPHEPDSAASHGWDWRKCCPAPPPVYLHASDHWLRGAGASACGDNMHRSHGLWA